MGVPYCIGSEHVSKDWKLKEILYDGSTPYTNDLSNLNSEPFVFLFPCEKPYEFSGMVDLATEKAQEWKDLWPEHYGAHHSPYIGTTASVKDSDWNEPHVCANSGCDLEPALGLGGCLRMDACFYDSTVCPKNSECQKDGSSCLCSSGFLSSVEGTPTLFTSTPDDLCIPAELNAQQSVGPTSFVFNIDKSKYTKFKVDMKRTNLDFPDQAPYSVGSWDGKDIDFAGNSNLTKGAYEFSGLLPGEEYTVKVTPDTDNTDASVQETKAITHCCCDCDTGIEADTSGRPTSLKVYQDDGHVMFNFIDNSRCSEAFAFTRSEVGGEFLDQDDETLKQVFTPNYYFDAKKKCGKAPMWPGISSSDDLSLSKLPVNKIYRYCVRAVAKTYSADSLQSSDETCQIHAIRWQASLDGAISSAPEAGQLPIEGVTVSWELFNARQTRVIASGSTITEKPGKFSIKLDELDKDLDHYAESPVLVKFSKTTTVGTSKIEHKFLCQDGEVDCTSDGILLYLKHLTFDQPLKVFDATTVPVRGHVSIMESDGCPLIGAKVCLKIKKARCEEAMEGPCVDTDSKGDFALGGAIGTTVYVEVSYKEHNIVRAPENMYDYESGFFIDPTKRYERNDFVDIQTAELEVQVAGGLCNHNMGTSTVNFKINGCSYWKVSKEQSTYEKKHNLPAHVLDVSIVSIVSHQEEGKMHRNVIEYFADKIESIDLTQLSRDDETSNGDKTSKGGSLLVDTSLNTSSNGGETSNGDDAATEDKKLVRFQYNGKLQLKFDLKGGQETGECDLSTADEGTSSFHVVGALTAFRVEAKLQYELLASESLHCDVVEDSMSVRFVNKVGIDSDFDTYATELQATGKESMVSLLKVCSADSGCIAEVKHDDFNGEKSNARAVPLADNGKDTLLVAGRPNIFGDHMKDLIVEALDADNQIVARHTAKIVVSGDFDQGYGLSFALPTHKPIMILRDPPGGHSTATYSNIQSTIRVTSTEMESLKTHEISYGLHGGIDWEDFGIAGTPFAGVEAKQNDLYIDVAHDGDHSWTSHEKQEEKSFTSEFTTTWSYTTSDDPLWAGRQSDIMVVPNLNVQYHDVVTLTFESEACKVNSQTSVKFNLDSPTNKPALSFLAVGYIEGQQLPKLEESYKNKEIEQKAKPDNATLKEELQTLWDAWAAWNETIKDYDEINTKAADGTLNITARQWFDKWATKTDNKAFWPKEKGDATKNTTMTYFDPITKKAVEMVVEESVSTDEFPLPQTGEHWSALAPEGLTNRAEPLSDLSYQDKIKEDSIKETNRIQFSGGGGMTEWAVGAHGVKELSKLVSGETREYSNFEGLELLYRLYGVGAGFSIGYTNIGEDSSLKTKSDEDDYETEISFALGDEQKWDEFVIDLYVDPTFGSFIFHTVSGVSSAPHEDNTRKGEDLRLEYQRPLLPAMPDEPLVFILEGSNFGENHGSNVQFEPDDSTNPKGLIYTSGGAQGGAPGCGMLKGTCNIVLELYKGPHDYIFPPMTFVIVSDWDDLHLEEVRVQLWNYQDKDGNLWIKYEEPCPAVEWVGNLGREGKVVVDKNAMPIDLTIKNPRRADGTLETIAEGRLDHVYALYRAQGTAEWLHAQLEDLSKIDFTNATKSEEDSYGFATIPFDISKRLTMADDGVYEVKIESRCKALSGAPKEFNTISTDPVVVVVDRVPPEQYGKALPISGVVIPGQEVSIAFTEPISCDLPYKFNMEVRLSGLDDLFDIRNLQIKCEGQHLAFQFDPSRIDYTLLMGKEMTVQIGGISDLQGNMMEDEIYFDMMVADLSVQDASALFTFTIPLESDCGADDLSSSTAIQDAIAKKLGLSDASRVEVETVECSTGENAVEARVKIGPSWSGSSDTNAQRRLRSSSSDQTVRTWGLEHDTTAKAAAATTTAIDAYYILMNSGKEHTETRVESRKLKSLAAISGTNDHDDFPFEVGHMELLPGKSDTEKYRLEAKPTKEEKMTREVLKGVDPNSLRQEEHILQLHQEMDNHQKESNRHMNDLDAKLDLLLKEMMMARRNKNNEKKNTEGYEIRNKDDDWNARSDRHHHQHDEEYQAIATLLERFEILAALLGMALFACILVLLMCIKTQR